MRNPLRSEAEAYRFLGVVIVGAVLIIVAAVINKWLGVAVAVLVFVGLFRWLRKEPVPGSADHAPLLASSTPPGTRRVLVLAPPGTESVAVPVAVEDALRAFGADEVLVAGDTELLGAIRDRVALPVSQL